jgi:hypothetical protein
VHLKNSDDQRLKSFLDRVGFHDLPVDIVTRVDREQDFIELAAQIKQRYHEIRDHSLNGAGPKRSEEVRQHEIIGHRN